MFGFMRNKRQPTAAELTTHALLTANYRAAAIFVLAGAAEVIEREPVPRTSEEKERQLTQALAAVAG